MLLFRQSQQTFRRNTLVRGHAEESARRHSHIVHKYLEMATDRKVLPRLPGIDRGHRNAQVRGDLLEGDVVFQSPVAERGRKAGADVAVELGLWGHGESLLEHYAAGKGVNPPTERRVIRQSRARECVAIG